MRTHTHTKATSNPIWKDTTKQTYAAKIRRGEQTDNDSEFLSYVAKEVESFHVIDYSWRKMKLLNYFLSVFFPAARVSRFMVVISLLWPFFSSSLPYLSKAVEHYITHYKTAAICPKHLQIYHW